MNISGKIAVVTGASSGIGAATAKLLAQRGARVVLLARNQEALQLVANEIVSQGGCADVYPVDLSQLEEISRVAMKILHEIGTPDILVNNAGVGRWLFLEETELNEAVAMMNVPYIAAFALTRSFLPSMLQQNSGCIVNITSIAAYFAWPGAVAYTAARWAMRGFNDALRADLFTTKVRVLLVAPAKVATPFFSHNPGSEERIPKISKLYPTLLPEQVANAIATGLEKNRREIIMPFGYRVTVFFHKLFPRSVEWLLCKTGAQRESSS